MNPSSETSWHRGNPDAFTAIAAIVATIAVIVGLVVAVLKYIEPKKQGIDIPLAEFTKIVYDFGEKNEALRQDIVNLRQEFGELKENIHPRLGVADSRTREERIAAKRKAAMVRREAEDTIDVITEEYRVISEIFQSERTRSVFTAQELEKWRAKVETLKAEKQALESIISELISIEDDIVL
uniref:Uncharacterized protein n=1 Tax=Candidatus Kentrum sp. UNK TaxID=2126344 RepID=A0A451AIW6_9GAMM|nr:MAG: hypothetical protein BECKUNK1418G_GA0071005_10748 [Candidatus Kentron sp. UNK]VFK70605.1 MAG: hypothetical protein BECKUNK1418H_GA0071006_103320 [Candidatus Kentron sp. UNK]